jgi:hypothetical protein
METASRDAQANPCQIHDRSISLPRCRVNRVPRHSPPITDPCSPISAFSISAFPNRPSPPITDY